MTETITRSEVNVTAFAVRGSEYLTHLEQLRVMKLNINGIKADNDMAAWEPHLSGHIVSTDNIRRDSVIHVSFPLSVSLRSRRPATGNGAFFTERTAYAQRHSIGK
jgi:hypothetical protein